MSRRNVAHGPRLFRSKLVVRSTPISAFRKARASVSCEAMVLSMEPKHASFGDVDLHALSCQ